MFVCVCKAITDHEICEQIKSGCESLASIEKACGAGSDCGSCKFRIQKLISENKNDEIPKSEAG